MQACPVCIQENIDTAWETAVGMCFKCALTYGIAPMRPARRPALPCQRCNGMQFIRAVPRELAAGNVGGEMNAVDAAPMMVTFQTEREQGWFSTTAVPVDPRKGFGALEQYICRKCGFVEWYCNDPENVPIGPGYMTEAIDYAASDTPYR